MRKQERLSARIPGATYRLQLNRDFTFADAGRIVSYLSDLGITDAYFSPYLRAERGSRHGYDIVDHGRLNPELGSVQDYNGMVEKLHRHGMGQVLDIVPNHMCITSSDNAWWMDVLENGPSSAYAEYFDIDWTPVKKELQNKVLLPVLGDQYGKVLENGELVLSFRDGAFSLSYYQHRFPIIPRTYILILKHRMEALREKLSTGNFLSEYESIITALMHLPPYTERDPEKISERRREKEVIKRRLDKLCRDCPDIREFIAENIRIYNGVQGEPASFDLLDELLSRQVYRLSFWRVATEEINYRRFFDINSLGSLRMERQEVFAAAHDRILKLVRRGDVTGLRVDHPDGLYDPSAYFAQLQKHCFLNLRLGHLARLRKEVPDAAVQPVRRSEILRLYEEGLAADPAFRPFYVIGEKILLRGERMPEEWPIFSTTGYVFINSVNGLFVDTSSARAFDEAYERFTGNRVPFADTVYEKKKLIMQVAMSSEINTLGHYLNTLSEKDRHTRDFTLNSLILVIVEVIAFFPVYRTYLNGYEVKERDRQYIEHAVAKAKRHNPATSASIFDFLKDVLTLRFPEDLSEEDRASWLDFVMRFQQISGPVMAKGVEDTAFYVYNRLVSLNEVGGMPDRFGTPLETFHGQNIERRKFWPHALIATSTHDTKRSEDVRARINVLSEIPAEWRSRLYRWSSLNRKRKAVVERLKVPDRNEEYLLYQTLIGAWPVGEPGSEEYEAFRGRIREYMLKAAREAKVNTSWINPNVIYEDALMIFVDAVLDRSSGNAFLEDFIPFQRTVSRCGMLNSLGQTLLKILSPGVPDFYQGTELWDFSLVDPDNRRPVDYRVRIRMLEDIRKGRAQPDQLSRELVADMESGRIKLYVTHKALTFRKQNRDLFEAGEYLPLDVVGNRADHVCSLARRIGRKRLIAAVPRFLMRLTSGKTPPLGVGIWEDTAIVIPFADAGAKYYNIFTGETVTAEERDATTVLPLAAVCNTFPVALLQRTV